MNKLAIKLSSVALAATIVGSGFSINANAATLETNAYEILDESILGVTDEFNEFTATVTFEPAPGTISTRDQTVPLGIGSQYYMQGDNWMILYGSNVVSLSGNKATMIGYGTAQVQAYKSNGAPLGVYTFVVKR